MEDKIKEEYQELVRSQETLRAQRANSGLENQANNSSDKDANICMVTLAMGCAGIGLVVGVDNVYNDYIRGNVPFFKYAKDLIRPVFYGLCVGGLWGFVNDCVGAAFFQNNYAEQTAKENNSGEKPVVR